MDEEINKVKKLPMFKHMPKKNIINDFVGIEKRLLCLNPHNTRVERKKYMAYDMPELNRYINGRRRGNIRGLAMNGKIAAIATHSNQGGYQIILRL